MGAFLGIELKRGLTAKGLRQAKVEFYLWSSCSLFPFVQIITDMQSGGVAFYSAGSSPTGVMLELRSKGEAVYAYSSPCKVACHDIHADCGLQILEMLLPCMKGSNFADLRKYSTCVSTASIVELESMLGCICSYGKSMCRRNDCEAFSQRHGGGQELCQECN